MNLIKKIKKTLLSKHFWTDGYGSFAVAILIALTIRWALLEAYVIPSGSMLPSLLIRDHIFVNKISYGVRVPFTGQWILKFSEPKRGDVIVFRYPEDPSIFYIKRVVGVGGDSVRYENGNLYVNNQVVEKHLPLKYKEDFSWLRDSDFREGVGSLSYYAHWEEHLNDKEDVKYSILLKKNRDTFFLNQSFGPYYVPKDTYFVLGDNRDNSQDSRFWKTTNYVPKDLLIGKAFIVWLSCEKTLPVLNFLCDPRYLRWGRFFHRIQ